MEGVRGQASFVRMCSRPDILGVEVLKDLAVDGQRGETCSRRGVLFVGFRMSFENDRRSTRWDIKALAPLVDIRITLRGGMKFVWFDVVERSTFRPTSDSSAKNFVSMWKRSELTSRRVDTPGVM